jgi:hypothetical protein
MDWLPEKSVLLNPNHLECLFFASINMLLMMRMMTTMTLGVVAAAAAVVVAVMFVCFSLSLSSVITSLFFWYFS